MKKPFRLTERGVAVILALGFLVAGLALCTGEAWGVSVAMLAMFSSVAVADIYYQPRRKK